MDLPPINFNYSNANRIKSELDNVEGFKWGRSADALMSALATPGYTDRLLTVAQNWLSARSSAVGGHLFSSAELKQKAKIEYALSLHQLSRIENTFFEVIFGKGRLLVETRNIARKEVLGTEEDKQCYTKLKKLLIENQDNLVPIIGYDKYFLTEKGNKALFAETPKSANSDGVCYSGCMYLAEKILKHPALDEPTLKALVQEFQKGTPAHVAAIQELYFEFNFINENPDITSRNTSDVIKSHISNLVVEVVYERALQKYPDSLPQDFIQELKKTIEAIVEGFHLFQDKGSKVRINRDLILGSLSPDLYPAIKKAVIPIHEAAFQNSPIKEIVLNALTGLDRNHIVEFHRDNAVAHLYGFKQDFEGTGKANKTLGDYEKLPSTKEHLLNFHLLDPGVYELTFKNLLAGHSLLYYKQPSQESYLIDLNFGLIKCDSTNPAKTLLQLLSLYPPPFKKLDHENDDRNYRLILTKFTNPLPELSI